MIAHYLPFVYYYLVGTRLETGTRSEWETPRTQTLVNIYRPAHPSPGIHLIVYLNLGSCYSRFCEQGIRIATKTRDRGLGGRLQGGSPLTPRGGKTEPRIRALAASAKRETKRLQTVVFDWPRRF